MAKKDTARGEETPEESEIHGDAGSSNGDVEMLPADDASQEPKRRLKEMEDESAAFRETQAKRAKEMDVIQDADGEVATQASKEEVDSRSVYVGNVDYSCTPVDVQLHFNPCGTVNRVTILTDQFGHPKGYAYVEFLEHGAIQKALLLDESQLHGRQLKVSAKRTNIPGMSMMQYQPWHFDLYMNPQIPPYYHSPYGYGKFARFRGANRYMPYY